jgi:hypothetical protein
LGSGGQGGWSAGEVGADGVATHEQGC